MGAQIPCVKCYSGVLASRHRRNWLCGSCKRDWPGARAFLAAVETGPGQNWSHGMCYRVCNQVPQPLSDWLPHIEPMGPMKVSATWIAGLMRGRLPYRYWTAEDYRGYREYLVDHGTKRMKARYLADTLTAEI